MKCFTLITCSSVLYPRNWMICTVSTLYSSLYRNASTVLPQGIAPHASKSSNSGSHLRGIKFVE